MLYVIPALGASLSCVDLVVLVRTKLRRDFILCFLPLSRFTMWVSKLFYIHSCCLSFLSSSFVSECSFTLQIAIILSSKFSCACCIFTSRILCLWWIFRFLTETLHLNLMFNLQVIQFSFINLSQ